MIRFEHIHYQRDGFELHVNLEVQRGKLCAVLGPSGAGKSTLLSIVAGFENVIGGCLFIGGDNMTGVAVAKRPVHLVFQSHNDFPHLSLFENVTLGISPNLKLDETQQGEVAQALARVGLQNLAERKPGQVSGGELQRMALARALVRRKPVLLLDEPFANLDPGLRREMLALVVELHRENDLTTLMVTHNPDDAHECDEVLFVGDGSVKGPSTTDDLLVSKDVSVKRYLGS